MSRGYFGIGVENIKDKHNVGGLWRSAHAFGAAFMFTVGRRYYRQPTDTTKAWTQVPLFTLDDYEGFQAWRPKDCMLIGIETGERDITSFVHPERAIYVLGAEDSGLSKKMKDRCSFVLTIPSRYCLNVATAGSIAMYDRVSKSSLKFKEVA